MNKASMEQPHQDEYEHLLHFLYACPIGLIDMTHEGTIELMTPLASNLLMPLATDGVLTNLLTALEDAAPELHSLIDDFTPRRGTICEHHRIHVDPSSQANADERRVLSCTVIKLNPNRYVVALTDVSAQVRQERRLREAETWFGSLLEGVKEFGVASLGTDGRIQAVNSTLVDRTGFAEQTLTDSPVAILVEADPADAASKMERRLEQAERDGWQISEGWARRSNGERYWCQSLIAVCAERSPDNGSFTRGYTFILREVARRDNDMLELKRLLRTDHLTGAYNRGAFFDAAEKAFLKCQKAARPLSMITLDIDHFKLINDTYGHGVGDEVLRSVSNACKAAVRPHDIFARIGGEEFAILLPDTTLEESRRVAERVRQAIATAPISVGEAVLVVTASFGCATGPCLTGGAAAILAASDAALYEAKRTGRNRIAWAPARTA